MSCYASGVLRNFQGFFGAVIFLATLCNPFHNSEAADELIINGGFDLTTVGPNRQVVDNADTTRYTGLTGWTTSTNTNDLTFVFTATAGDTTGAQGRYYTPANPFQLWGLNNGGTGAVGPSPLGGNYLASDGDSGFNVPISQTVTGLTIGQSYELNFYWAAAQQFTFDGPTTERWQVSLGAETQTTSTYSLPNHGFSGWMETTMTFTATSTSSVLSFLAVGTPNGLPPFCLLDGVSLMAVPEPTVSLLVITALVGGAMVRRRWKNSRRS